MEGLNIGILAKMKSLRPLDKASRFNAQYRCFPKVSGRRSAFQNLNKTHPTPQYITTYRNPSATDIDKSSIEEREKHRRRGVLTATR